MDTLKKLFYFTYALVALVIIGILFFNVSLSEMLGAEGTTTFWMTVALLLLGMLTVGVVGDYLETRSLAKKVGRLNKENTDLKAQLFEHMNRSSINGNTTSSSPSGNSWLNRIGLGGKSDLPNQPNTDH